MNLNKELGIKENEKVLMPDIRIIKNNVLGNINSAPNERKLNVLKTKRMVLIALAATLVLGVTVFAASNFFITNWVSHSNGEPEYTSLPTAKQCHEDVGYVPVLIEKFENGYSFDNGSVVHNSLKDDSGKNVEKFKSLFFRYEKDGDLVNLTQEKYKSDVPITGKVIGKVEGITLYSDGYTSKIVPPNYEMTDEDKEAEASGELVFSYGSSEVQIKEVKTVTWEKDGINYSLMQIDGELSENELIKMAEEIIKN